MNATDVHETRTTRHWKGSAAHRLRRRGDDAVALSKEQLLAFRALAVGHIPSAPPDERDQLMHVKAAAAAALVELGQSVLRGERRRAR